MAARAVGGSRVGYHDFVDCGGRAMIRSKMKSIYRTRGSSADREIFCAGAIGCEREYNDNSQDARTGSAMHALLAKHVLDQEYDIALTATQYSAPLPLLKMAFFNALRILEELEDFFPNPCVEHRLDGLTTMGTTDLMSFVYDGSGTPEHIRILDYKLDEGWHPYQLRSYALAAVDMFGFPSSGYVDGIEAWAIPETYHLSRFTEDDLEAFRSDLMGQHERAGKQFSAGLWCRFCPIRIDCQARDQYLRSTVSAIAEVQGSAITRDQLAALYPKAKMLKKALAEFNNAVKLEIENGGPLTLEDGSLLGFKERNELRFPKPYAALKAIENEVEVNKLISISKASLERAVKAMVPDGQGAPTVRRLLKQLEDGNLTETERTKRLAVIHGG
jgi:hypothetical protein